MKRLELIVSLDQIVANARELRKRVDSRVKMLAVVKADAYGHGAAPVARALLREGLADFFAVATSDEGAFLRKNGIDQTPIVVLGAAGSEEAETSVRFGLSQAVFSASGLETLSQAARAQGKRAKAHLKVDTGMARIGVRNGRELEALLDAWTAAPEVEMEGMFTHFCAADTDKDFTEKQFERFTEMVDAVCARGFHPICHAAASTAMLEPRYGLDMVRAGIALYGTGVETLKGVVEPAQTLISHPVRVEWIEPGDTVGYSRRFTAERRTLVMTVPCGYGDGYPRLLSGKADVLVNGRRVPVIGNVCMDMLMADATDAGEIDVNTPVVLMGTQGDERISPDELSEKARTIPYEIMLGFADRVSRSWIHGGKREEEK